MAACIFLQGMNVTPETSGPSSALHANQRRKQTWRKPIRRLPFTPFCLWTPSDAFGASRSLPPDMAGFTKDRALIQTPYYLIDKSKLLQNMEKIATLRELSGAKALLALKCFATWSVFDFMRDYMDGTTSSSLNEVRLGHERFGKETHAYSRGLCRLRDRRSRLPCRQDHLQLDRPADALRDPVLCIIRGLRLNPGVSSSSFDLADPARPFSRLGEWDLKNRTGHGADLRFHDPQQLRERRFRSLRQDARRHRAEVRPPVEEGRLGVARRRHSFHRRELSAGEVRRAPQALPGEFGVQVYLEPGEASITKSTTLEVTVLDKLHNGKDLVVVDSSIEAHLLDLLIYRKARRSTPTRDRTVPGLRQVLPCGRYLRRVQF